MSCSDGSIHDNHVALGHRVRTQSVVIIIIDLKVRFYYIVESNDEEDS